MDSAGSMRESLTPSSQRVGVCGTVKDSANYIYAGKAHPEKQPRCPLASQRASRLMQRVLGRPRGVLFDGAGGHRPLGAAQPGDHETRPRFVPSARLSPQPPVGEAAVF